MRARTDYFEAESIMTFDEYWKRLNAQRAITGRVSMTPAQAEKFARQAYDAGYRQRSREWDEADELRPCGTSSWIPDFMRGVFGDNFGGKTND